MCGLLVIHRRLWDQHAQGGNSRASVLAVHWNVFARPTGLSKLGALMVLWWCRWCRSSFAVCELRMGRRARRMTCLSTQSAIPAPDPEPLDPPDLSHGGIFLKKNLPFRAATLVVKTIPSAEQHESAEQVTIQRQGITTFVGSEFKLHSDPPKYERQSQPALRQCHAIPYHPAFCGSTPCRKCAAWERNKRIPIDDAAHESPVAA